MPPERRSATLNLVYLPLYAAGIIGPALGGGVATAGGLPSTFLLGGLVLVAGAVVIALRVRIAHDGSPRGAEGAPHSL